MANLNIELTEELESFVSRSILEDGYQDASAVVCSALHSLEREKAADAIKETALREALEEGLASGVARGDVFAQIKRRIKHEARLPGRRP